MNHNNKAIVALFVCTTAYGFIVVAKQNVTQDLLATHNVCTHGEFPAEIASWLMLVFHATRNPGGGGVTGSIDTGGVGEKGGAAWAVAEEEC